MEHIINTALPLATYYVNDYDDTYLKYNVITEILFDGTESGLNSAIDSFKHNIKIRNLFGNKDNICYKICYAISKCYDVLLVDQLDSVLIVTRKDNVIKLTKSSDKVPRFNDFTDKKIGIIKIDSVIAEMNLMQIGRKSGLISGLKYLLGVTTISCLGYMYLTGVLYCDALKK